MEDISMHILDIAENSIAAGADLVTILITEDRGNDLLSLEIRDSGRGMDEEILASVTSPFTTTRTTRRVGLGLALLSQTAKSTGGSLKVESTQGAGTKVKAHFGLSHVDLPPMGDLEATLTTLIVGNPELDIVFSYSSKDKEFLLDTCALREQLDGIPFSNPGALRFLREEIKAGLAEVVKQEPGNNVQASSEEDVTPHGQEASGKKK